MYIYKLCICKSMCVCLFCRWCKTCTSTSWRPSRRVHGSGRRPMSRSRCVGSTSKEGRQHTYIYQLHIQSRVRVVWDYCLTFFHMFCHIEMLICDCVCVRWRWWTCLCSTWTWRISTSTCSSETTTACQVSKAHPNNIYIYVLIDTYSLLGILLDRLWSMSWSCHVRRTH